ncbi:MAG: hypothetical protein UU03_C0019G0011 [Candidatus Woesebacteria bacterium GW2011_GWA1_40_45]|uniref:Uncharacterized protein n=1 Tax=Candidatus Woesebacteria bacterium GW2011_GWA1_40_45 TaxID=1618554 RepID=A0A0G0VJQ3_9BACT|nr:MAG: hypothetical protein UU03_C0019G0011 [Candidatus Woesebacteria bacterium GW2011_GWA1_40_45]
MTTEKQLSTEIVKRVCLEIHNSFAQVINNLNIEINKFDDKLTEVKFLDKNSEKYITELTPYVSVEAQRNQMHTVIKALDSVCQSIRAFAEENETTKEQNEKQL